MKRSILWRILICYSRLSNHSFTDADFQKLIFCFKVSEWFAGTNLKMGKSNWLSFWPSWNQACNLRKCTCGWAEKQGQKKSSKSWRTLTVISFQWYFLRGPDTNLSQTNLNTKKRSTASFASLMVDFHKFNKKFKRSSCQSKRFYSSLAS